MAVLAISRNPHHYGFDEVELDDPMKFDEVAFQGAVDLRAIARLADCSYEELRELNPAVHRGETLQQIANRYGVSARDLARVNGIGRQRPLRRGTTLTVPASIVSPAMAVLADNDPRASTGYVPQRTLAIPASLDGHSDAEGRLTVRVQRGQTLDMIAAEHGVTANDLRRWNHLDSSRLRRGQRLKVRVGEAAVEDTAARDSIEVAKLAHLRMPQPRHR